MDGEAFLGIYRMSMPRGTESWDGVLLSKSLKCVFCRMERILGNLKGGRTKRIKGRTSGTEKQHGYLSMMMQ